MVCYKYTMKECETKSSWNALKAPMVYGQLWRTLESNDLGYMPVRGFRRYGKPLMSYALGPHWVGCTLGLRGPIVFSKTEDLVVRFLAMILRVSQERKVAATLGSKIARSSNELWHNPPTNSWKVCFTGYLLQIWHSVIQSHTVNTHM